MKVEGVGDVVVVLIAGEASGRQGDGEVVR